MKQLFLLVILSITSFQVVAQAKYEIIRENSQEKDKFIYNVTSLKNLSYAIYHKEYLNNTLINKKISEMVFDFERKKVVKLFSKYIMSNDSTLSLNFRNTDGNGINLEFKFRKMTNGNSKNIYKPYTIIPCQSKSIQFVDGYYVLKLETICQDYWNADDKCYKHCSLSDYSKKSLHYFEFGVIIFQNEKDMMNYYKNN